MKRTRREREKRKKEIFFQGFEKEKRRMEQKQNKNKKYNKKKDHLTLSPCIIAILISSGIPLLLGTKTVLHPLAPAVSLSMSKY